MILEDLLMPSVVIPWLLGMIFGVFVGATPGLTTTMAVALIVPFSFHLEPTAGLALIIGVSFTAIFAGDIPATYMRIPGTPASAAATLDGHAMAKRGLGHYALSLDLICSVLGGLIGVGLLIQIAPLLAKFALRFTNYEYFWIAVAGLCISALMSQSGIGRGLVAAFLGLLLSTIGMDIVSGSQRFTFGSYELLDGLSFIPVMIGLFGVSEVLRNLHTAGIDSTTSDAPTELKQVSHVRIHLTLWRHKWTMIRSSLTGTFIGALPGAGADIAAWVAYGLAKKTSPRGSEFGTGIEEGVIAPTSANNAAVAGAWIPALVFGVPGDAVTAIVLGALLMYDIKPGPMIFEQSGDQVRAIFSIALATQFLLLIAGFIGIKAFALILRLPRGSVLTAVMLFSVVGSFACRNSLFDIWVMLGAGVAGYLLESKRIPMAPIILGLILGPMVEENFRTGLIKSSGSLSPFFTRPLCALILVTLLGVIMGPRVVALATRKQRAM